MRFTETTLRGAFILDLEARADPRGFFARTFCAREFAEHGLSPTVAQCSIAFNHHQGTIRGIHFQRPPQMEAKLVRCTRGAIYDVIIDLRPESPTYMQHIAVELTADNYCALYVPEQFAHGYQTLTDNAEVTYQMNEFYTPGYEGGLRYNDPALGIDWPLPVSIIADKDLAWPLLETTA